MPRLLFARPLARREAAQLQRLLRKVKNRRELCRARAVLLSSRGHTCPEIARRLGISVPTVTRAINRYNRKGLSGVAEGRRSGRPAKACRRYIDLLRRIAACSPRKLGIPSDFWTRPQLCEYLRRRTGILICPVHLSRLMSRHGIHHRKHKHRAR